MVEIAAVGIVLAQVNAKTYYWQVYVEVIVDRILCAAVLNMSLAVKKYRNPFSNLLAASCKFKAVGDDVVYETGINANLC